MAKLMTMKELIEKCGEGDPLYSEPEQLFEESPSVLIIYGYDNNKGYADDLRITIGADSLTLRYKEPVNPDATWQAVGETCAKCPDHFDCLHGWVYSL